jgi:hypothetical protein
MCVVKVLWMMASGCLVVPWPAGRLSHDRGEARRREHAVGCSWSLVRPASSSFQLSNELECRFLEQRCDRAEVNAVATRLASEVVHTMFGGSCAPHHGILSQLSAPSGSSTRASAAGSSTRGWRSTAFILSWSVCALCSQPAPEGGK